MSKILVLAASIAVALGSVAITSGVDARHVKHHASRDFHGHYGYALSAMLREGSTGTTDMLQGTRKGSIRAPCMLRTCRLRATTTIRAFRTFSLDPGADVLS